MTERPTQKELNQKIKVLEEEVSRLKHLEKTLRDDEQRLRAFVDQASDAIFVSDLEGHIVDCNHLAATSTGYSREELLSMGVADLDPEYVRHDHPGAIWKDLKPGRPVTIEGKHKRKAGTLFPVEIRIARLRVAGSDVIFGLARDVSERKKRERELRESEERFRTTFHTSPDSININRFVDGLYIDVNKGFTALTGYERKDVIGKTSIEIDIWADPRDGQRLVQGLEKKGFFENLEAKFRLKDGTVKTGLMSAKVIMLQGEPHILSITRDIEDLKKAELAIRESEEKYRQVVDNANDAIFIAQDGLLKFANPKTNSLTGYPPEEQAKTPFLELIYPEDRDLVAERHKRRLAGEDFASTYSFRIVNRKGEVLWVQLNTVLTDWEGRPATLNFLRDITEQRKLEAQFQAAQRIESVGTLAGGIAHDFNNLLMGIQGRTSLILMDKAPGDPDVEHLKGIENYVKSAASLTRQLLGFARGGKYEVKPTDINQFIEKSAQMFGRTKKEIKIHRKYQEHIWTVEVDRGQMEQVLMNLYINAWQAMPGGGNLYLQTENIIIDEEHARANQVDPRKYVCISVTDSGVGMEETTRQKIFEPFFTTKEMGRGTGLGLASAYGIIRNHGGFITVESEKGQGTTFHIFLPASSKVIADSRQAGSEQIRHGHGRILLIDDEEMVLDVGGEMLKALGYEPLKARNGKEAINIFAEQGETIDMVILDLIMPDMDGGKVYIRLKEIKPGVKVLLASGYSIDGEATKILQKGCNGFIQKPFSMKDLSEKLRAMLDKCDQGPC